MKKRKKKNISPSAKVASFWQEIGGDLFLLAENIGPLVTKLKSLAAREQEEFFYDLFNRELSALPLLIENIWGKDEHIDLIIINSLGAWPSPQAGEFLESLAARTQDKKMLKAIRRSLFRLKSKGLKVGEIKDQEPAIFSPPKLEPAQGYVSACDSEGSRIIIISRPQIPKGIINFEVVLNDEEGILNYSVRELTKKLSSEYLANLKKEILFSLVEMDANYCLGLIAESMEAGQKKGKNPPADFIQWLPYFGSPPPLPLKPVIYQYLPIEEINTNTDLLDRSPTLFEMSPFYVWFLEKEEIQRHYDLYKEALASRLILSPEQKEARLEDIYSSGAQELFGLEKRMIYRRRLEEMAYILWKEGKEQAARICISAALALEKESGLLSPHPFLRALIKRSLEKLLAAETESPENKESSLITGLWR